MTVKRTSPPGAKLQPGLPHDQDREGGQPYAKEVDDYQGGVVSPPDKRRRREDNPQATKALAKK